MPIAMFSLMPAAADAASFCCRAAAARLHYFIFFAIFDIAVFADIFIFTPPIRHFAFISIISFITFAMPCCYWLFHIFDAAERRHAMIAIAAISAADISIIFADYCFRRLADAFSCHLRQLL